MSEYQYYEFRAIDQPLTEAQKAAVEALSSRAHVTAYLASFVYNYGDFRGNPEQLMADYFDAMIYLANWGSRRIMFRLPQALIDTKLVGRYCVSEAIDRRTTRDKKYVIVDLEFHDEEHAVWTEGEGWLDALVALRDELLQGDFRVLYLAWLKAAKWALEIEDIDGDTVEPPVPPGLGHLSPALTAFVEFLDIDEALLAVAAQNSADPQQEHGHLEPWIERLPEAERLDFLQRLSRGEKNVGVLLNRRLQDLATAAQPHTEAPETTRRTIATLFASATTWRQKKLEAEQHQAEAARRCHLEALATRESQTWQEIEALIEEKKATAYESAVKLLVDLRDLAQHQGQQEQFGQRVADIERTYATRSALLRRMRQASVVT